MNGNYDNKSNWINGRDELAVSNGARNGSFDGSLRADFFIHLLH